MSKNLDLVRSIYAAQERGDWSIGEWAHPDIEFVRVDGPEVGTWTGRERVEEAVRDRVSAWEDFRRHAEEFRELDDERVLVVSRRSGRARATGLDIEQLDAGARAAAVVHICDGRVTRILAYWDRDRALADLGLKE